MPRVTSQGDDMVVLSGPNGEDELVFRRTTSIFADKEAWIADWELYDSYDKRYYRVFQWKDGWAGVRPNHPVLGKFDREWDERRIAMLMCADDFATVMRLYRWTEHMKNNEPPPMTGDW